MLVGFGTIYSYLIGSDFYLNTAIKLRNIFSSIFRFGDEIEMKLIVGTLLAVLAITAQAEKVDIDWSKVKPISDLYKINEHRRIFGGKPASKSQFPYQAGLLLTPIDPDAGHYVCGGSLISSTRVLTAAHCIKVSVAALVILGAINLFEDESTQVRFNVPENGLVCHPDFDPNTLHNDIAMIKFPSAVKFNDYISPIALAEGTDDFVGDTGITSGWGHFDNTQQSSSYLRFDYLKVIENWDCMMDFADINDDSICAQGSDNAAGCYGDSGELQNIQHLSTE